MIHYQAIKKLIHFAPIRKLIFAADLVAFPLSKRNTTVTLPKPTVGEQNFGKSGDIGTDFGCFFFVGRRLFFVEAPKLKVLLTDPPIFRGFVIGEASGDGRPMIGRQSVDVLKKELVARFTVP